MLDWKEIDQIAARAALIAQIARGEITEMPGGHVTLDQRLVEPIEQVAEAVLKLAKEIDRIKGALPAEKRRLRLGRHAHDLPSRLRSDAKDGVINDIVTVLNAADELERLTKLEAVLAAMEPNQEGGHRPLERVRLLEHALREAIDMPKGEIPPSAAGLI